MAQADETEGEAFAGLNGGGPEIGAENERRAGGKGGGGFKKGSSRIIS